MSSNVLAWIVRSIKKAPRGKGAMVVQVVAGSTGRLATMRPDESSSWLLGSGFFDRLEFIFGFA